MSSSASSMPQAENGLLAKIRKRAVARLADLTTEEDIQECLQIIRGALRATNRVVDLKTGRVMEFPDHKTRLAAASVLLAHSQGLPSRESEKRGNS